MNSTLLVLLCATVAHSWFGPNVRIDHQNHPAFECARPAVTLGPGAPSSQPIYVAFEADSFMGIAGANILFQKSTDAGRTWLSADVLLRRTESRVEHPDITTDPCGNVYVVYDSESAHMYCMRSTDGGATWSSPSLVDGGGIVVGSGRIAADSAGNLLCAWNGRTLDDLHIFLSVSTDRGATWKPGVRVDEDTTNWGCFQPDVFVQPGTNDYLVAAEVPFQGGAGTGCYLYRSTDMGKTFQPGVRLDTFGVSTYQGQPHVVADGQHVICDYSGGGDQFCEARTLYTLPDTWGAVHLIGHSYQNGDKLAISADGRVHTALMVHVPGDIYHTYYSYSLDHGVSWSDPELVNNDTAADAEESDIGADSVGHANIVWRDLRDGSLWFATNNPAGIAEQPVPQSAGVRSSPTVVRGVLFLAERPSSSASTSSLLDISGREIMGLKPGANDVNRLSPGVYFVRSEPSAASRQQSAVTKVVVTR